MLDRVLTLGLAAVLAGTPLPAATQDGARNAVRGDAVTGALLTDDGNVLQLDISPCAATRTVVVFHRPYTKQDAGAIHCGGEARAVVQAIQQ